MLKILICDDDPVCLEKVHRRVRSIYDTAMITVYQRQEEITPSCLSDCGIALLDIDFRGQDQNGIQIAQRLRKVNRDAVIIFITNYVEYAPEGYEVQAFRYLLKKDIDKKLKPYLQDAIEKLEQTRETVTVTVSGEPITIQLRDVLYIEAQAHNALIYIQRQTDAQSQHLRIYASLKSLDAQLSPRGFLRIQKSFLANMRRIRRFQSTGAELDDGTILPVSPKTYTQQKSQYLLWKGRH